MNASGCVRWGVIGAGGIADRRTIPGLLQADRCALEMVMDVAGAGALAAKYGLTKYADTLEPLLADPDIDAVYIATPVHLHLEQITRAARAGKHVLCEKPLTLNADQAREAVRVCQEQGVLLQEGYMMKFHGAHRRIRTLLREGRLGTVAYMRARLSCWYPPIPGAWRQDPKLGGGGVLIDMASHLYDLLEYLNGPITGLFARTASQVHRYPSEDASVTVLEFDNGALATIDCFFNIPDEAAGTRLEIFGSLGGVLAEGTIGQGDGGTVEACLKTDQAGYDAMQDKGTPPRYSPVAFDRINPYTAECAYFADCILDGKAVEINNGDHAVRQMELIETAYASARTGQRLPAPP